MFGKGNAKGKGASCVYLMLNRVMGDPKKRSIGIVSAPSIKQNDPSSVRCYLTVGHIPI